MPDNITRRFSIYSGQIFLMFVLFAITFAPFLLAINYIPLDDPTFAFDWRNSFHGAIWLEDFGWGIRSFQTPPWSVWFLLPITALPFKLGWATLMYLTMLVLVLSVPRKPSRKLWFAGILLLLTTHPTLRNFADGNLEFFVIAGLLISLYAYREKKPYLLSFGLLMAAIKPQEVYLTFAVMGLFMLKTFHWRDIAKVIVICGGVFISTMLIWGQAWYSMIDALPTGISLTAAIDYAGFPAIAIRGIQISLAIISVFIAWRGEPTLDRNKVGLLIAASLLAAPYANGLSLVTSLAFGGIAIFIKRPRLGVLMFVLYNFPYVEISGIRLSKMLSSLYFMIIHLVMWVILLFDVYQQPTAKNVETSIFNTGDAGESEKTASELERL